MVKILMNIKVIAVVLAITFSSGQLSAVQLSTDSSNNNLGPSIALDTDINPARSKPVQNDISGALEPGAIGNGVPLLELAQGKPLPQRITDWTTELELKYGKRDEFYNKIAISIDCALGAIKWASLFRRIPGEHSQRVRDTVENLVALRDNLSKLCYLFNADIRSKEDYLIGFNRDGYFGYSVELIDRLYDISPKRLAQYLFHECVPEEGPVTDRAFHRTVYDVIQHAVFRGREVADLKSDFRGFIDEKAEDAFATVENARKSYVARKAGLREMANRRAFLPFIGHSARHSLSPEGYSLKDVALDPEVQTRLLCRGVKKYNTAGAPNMMDLSIEQDEVFLANLSPIKKAQLKTGVSFPDEHMEVKLSTYGWVETLIPFEKLEREGGLRPDMTVKLRHIGIEWETQDWDQLKVPDFGGVGRSRIAGETVKKLKNALGDKTVIGYVMGPYSIAERLVGDDIGTIAQMYGDEKMDEVLRYCEKVTGKYAEYLIESGADVIAILDPTPTGLLSPADLEKYSVAPVNRLSQEIRKRGALCAYHPCRPNDSAPNVIEARLDAFSKADIDILSIDAVYNLRQVYDHILNKVGRDKMPVLLGNICTKNLLPDGTPGRVASAVETLFNEMGPGRPFLCGSSCDITFDAAKEPNMQAFSDTAIAKAKEISRPRPQEVSEEIYKKIEEALPVRGYAFNFYVRKILNRIMASDPNKFLFIGVEDQLDPLQESQIMPLFKVIDKIKELKDENGNPLFPNLVAERGSAKELVDIASGLAGEGKLDFNDAFIGARWVSVKNSAYDALQGKGAGRAWISAVDDSQYGDYLPIFEAITINMMAYMNADLSAIKNYCDAISMNPIHPDALQEMIRNRVLYILPRITRFNPKQLRELYELAQQVYASA